MMAPFPPYGKAWRCIYIWSVHGVGAHRGHYRLTAYLMGYLAFHMLWGETNGSTCIRHGSGQGAHVPISVDTCGGLGCAGWGGNEGWGGCKVRRTAV